MADYEPSFWRRIERESFARANAKLAEGKHARRIAIIAAVLVGALRMFVTPADPDILSGLRWAACSGSTALGVSWLYGYFSGFLAIPSEWDATNAERIRALEPFFVFLLFLCFFFVVFF